MKYSSFVLQYSAILKSCSSWCLFYVIKHWSKIQLLSTHIHSEELPFSAWSMICRSAFFRLLALSISCSLDLKGLDWSELLSSGEIDPDGTSWALASSLRALTRESSFSFNMAHWERHTKHKSKQFFLEQDFLSDSSINYLFDFHLIHLLTVNSLIFWMFIWLCLTVHLTHHLSVYLKMYMFFRLII